MRERGIWRGTLLRRRRDGTTFPAACTVVGLKDPAGRITHFVGVERDITDELKLRDQLVHSERLSAIGELVAGVAHEINNPLQTIVGAVELMLDGAAGPGDAARSRDGPPRGRARRTDRAQPAVVRAAQRSRPRGRRSQRGRSAPRSSCASITCMQHNITLVTELQSGAVPVLVNREEIQQIVLNLVLNAEQAILTAGRGSRITVRSYSSAGIIRSSRWPMTAPASAPSCGDGSSSRSSRRRRWGRERASACRFRTASPPRTAGRSISVRERRARASG